MSESPEVYNFDAYGTHVDVFLLKAGEVIPEHTHAYEHKIFLARGEAVITVNGLRFEKKAPCEFRVDTRFIHSIQARTDAFLVNVAPGEAGQE